MGVNGIYGLSGSGLDIESMVKVGMLNKQSQYDRMYKKETKQMWEKQAYSEIYSTLNTFNSSTLSKFKMQSNMNAMTASSNNTSAVTATANGEAASMAHSVEVSSLSSNAYLISADEVTRANTSDDAKASSDLKDVLFKSLVKNSDGTYTVTDADDNETTVSGSDTALKFSLSDGNTVGTISYTYADLYGTDDNDAKTMNDMAYDMRQLGTNVKAYYDSTNDVFSLYNGGSGSENKISLTMADADQGGANAAKLFNNLHLQQSANGSLDGADQTYTAGVETSVAGDSGKVKIDGREYSMNNNKLTVGGVTYTFLDTTEKAANITVSQDTETIVENVKSFVEEYNKILDGLNDKYYEKKYSDYQPLTKSQEDAMTEKQIEKWNEKAQSGMLNHSSQLRKIIDNMRDAIANPIASIEGKLDANGNLIGQYNSAYSIGIDTSTDQGRLRLDEDKLRAALTKDPNCVYNIFGSMDDNDDPSNMGIANRLSDIMHNGLKDIEKHAGKSSATDDDSALGQSIRNWLTKMSDFKTMMDAFESQLYKKYDALEVALSRMGMQLGFITGGSN